MCKQCDAMDKAVEEKANTEKYLKDLPDKSYAALNVSIDIENLEFKIKENQRTLKDLKKRFSKIKKHLPKVPDNLSLSKYDFDAMNYRWRGRRDIEKECYGHPKED